MNSRLTLTPLCAALLVSLLVTSCAAASSTASPVRADAAATSTAMLPVLPYAENVLEMSDAPLVALNGSRITVDGVPAGDVSAILTHERVQRIDELFNVLKARRDRWKGSHPDAPFPGVNIFRIDPSVKAVVVKSMFQTAAFAGYPNGSFMVRRIPAGDSSEIGRLIANAQLPSLVPGASHTSEPPGKPEERKKVLHVEVAKEKFVLVWKQAGAVIATVDIPRKEALTHVGDAGALRFPELASKISKEWSENGQHRVPTDRRWDQAVVRVPDDEVRRGWRRKRRSPPTCSSSTSPTSRIRRSSPPSNRSVWSPAW